ncbi:hypothetical protein K8R66_00585 [bacterium]|nr:hypothetical protein [bacterium]
MINSQQKKSLLLIILSIFVVLNFSFLSPQKVQAGVVTDVLGAPIAAGKWIWDRIESLGKAIKSDLIATAFKQALRKMVNQMAYQATNDLFAGFEGGKSAFNFESLKESAKKAGDAGLADFLISITDEMGGGLDICNPPSGGVLKWDLQWSLWKKQTTDDFKPRCSLNKIKEKWGALGEKLVDDPGSWVELNGQNLKSLGLTGDDAQAAKLKLMRGLLSPKQSDLGFIETIEKMAKEKEKKAEDDEKEKQTVTDDKTNKAETDEVTDQLIAPAETTKEKSKVARAISQAEQAVYHYTGNPFADVPSILFSVAADRATELAMKHLMRLLMGQKPELDLGDRPVDPENQMTEIRDYIDQVFSSIQNIYYGLNPKDIDVIGEMETNIRDDNSGIPGKLNDGVIDSGFAQVLRDAQSGESVTLGEAVKKGSIDGSKIFGFSNLGDQGALSQPSLGEGFSYDNIKKLRRNRVVPVGWEMAALKIATFPIEWNGEEIYPGNCNNNGCTLLEVMDKYNDRGHYLLNGESTKDKYCGWRPINFDPYFVEDINTESACENQVDGFINKYEETIAGIITEWHSSRPNSLGYCYEYQFDEDKIIIDIVDVTVTYGTKQECIGTDEVPLGVDKASYRQWEVGGCRAIEIDESPLCGLVNPNWVLKAPSQQCGTEGYYAALEMNESANRYQDCADLRHCIQEDDNGKCQSYAYCLREKNIWRFNGDACDDQFNSCLTLKDSDGDKRSYLLNSLATCPPEQVNCRRYFDKYYKGSTQSYEWDLDEGTYLNKNVLECSDSNQGCSSFIKVGLGANLIPNGSFEIDEGFQNNFPDGWVFPGNQLFELSDEELFHDRNSLKCSEGDVFYINFKLPSKGIYTLSYFVKPDGLTNIMPRVNIYYSDGSVQTNSNLDSYFTADGAGSDWERASGYFSVNTTDNKEVDYAQLRFDVAGSFYMDAIKFELNEFNDGFINEGEGQASSYSEYGKNDYTYLKKAPEYYNCDSNPDKDICQDFARYCSKDDAGCEAYYPTESGDPMVPAVLNVDDLCPSECKNFNTFAELPSRFDILEAQENGFVAQNRDLNFITDTAQDCNEPSCEVFTNLDELDQGGESIEYYSALRQCVKNSEVDDVIYYTWEGSDTSGFQLKTWNLLNSQRVDAYNDGQGGWAPCTNVEIGDIGCLDEYATIGGFLANVIECNPEDDFDCRTFYDEQAVPHNRLLSRTIPISSECISLRR